MRAISGKPEQIIAFLGEQHTRKGVGVYNFLKNNNESQNLLSKKNEERLKNRNKR